MFPTPDRKRNFGEEFRTPMESEAEQFTETSSDDLHKKRERFVDELIEPLQHTARVAMAETMFDAERKKKHIKEALADEITGLATRRVLERQVNRVVREQTMAEGIDSKRDATNSSLVLLDADKFKEINDSFGHAAGNEALRKIAEAMQTFSRPIDLPARIGGDEFALLFDGLTAAQAEHRLKDPKSGHQIIPIEFDYKGIPVQFTVSFGVADIKGNDTLDDVMERADKKMYNNKAAYKNNQSNIKK